MMAARIRVGIVGATVTAGGSGWGAHAHVPALQALPKTLLQLLSGTVYYLTSMSPIIVSAKPIVCRSIPSMLLILIH